ncbi:MoaD/ThiS family protein [Jannaschia sp. R86511]|uniref:MoaD/ThiS family protein n=1 Tax=Jannaschia sp. R86511 TaxID=3093853 RepID=UPI0036D2E385
MAEGRVRVRFFAGARAAAGERETTVEVLAGDRVADVLGRLGEARPELVRVVAACSFLLDGVSARSDAPLAGAAELDVLPPFSGG